MAKRSSKCSKDEIISLINSDSDSSDDEKMKCTLNHLQEAKNNRLTDTSKRASLRIKLRRSRNESMFKIARNSGDDVDLEKNDLKSIKRSTRLQNKSVKQESHVTKNSKDDSESDSDILLEVIDKVKPIDSAKKNTRKSSSKSKSSNKQLATCTEPETIKSPENKVNINNFKNKENEPSMKSSEDSHLSEEIDEKHTVKKKNPSHSIGKNYNSKDVTCKAYSDSHSKEAQIKRRTVLAKEPITPLQEARTRLHVSFVPKSLPCREQEFNDIFSFLERKLIDKNGGCIYISGVPGTGKTATVNEVIKCLKKSVDKGNLDNFDYVEINSMKLSEPRQVYVQILKQLSGEILLWEPAYRTLEKMFNSKTKNSRKSNNLKSKMTLLLVDELDFLCTKRQDVVYNILDWPTKQSARLVVITIANTMDLPERLLMSRVTSRLGLTRLTFQPYDYKQLHEIVSTRLKSNSVNSFKSEAIQLVARKVSAVSGDARRALDICRRATEIAESRGMQVVGMQDVNQALLEMIATAKIQAIKYCSLMEQIFLQAVCAEIARTGIEETCFKNVYYQFTSLCSFDGIKIPTLTETLAICARLGSSRLLICEHSRHDIYQKILLNVSSDDVHYALKKID